MAYTLLLLLLTLSQVLGGPLKNCPGKYHEDPALTRFRRYIQIDTSKEENLKRAVEFWRQQAVELGLPFHVFSPSGLPVCVITIIGTDPSLPSIMLNSHMDVVPAIENEWTYPPYSAYVDENGDIYGRGSQDAKDITCQYMEAVRRIKNDNVMLKRNLHITLMPDEETGGFRGMKAFVKTEAFKAMNVGFVLDEGLSSTDGLLLATYQDRRPWQFLKDKISAKFLILNLDKPLVLKSLKNVIRHLEPNVILDGDKRAELQVTVHGEGGHGSGMPDNSAMDKTRIFMNVVNEYRDRMKAVMKSVDPRDYGGYTSLNLNIVAGGYRPNIIPSEFSMVVDMRLSTESNVTEVEQLVQSWIAETGHGTELTFIRRDDVSEKTTLDDSNPYWVAMREAVNKMNLEIAPVVCPATSDSLVLRNIGIPSVGFSPKLRTTSRIHSKNEYLNSDTFLKGIDIYTGILRKLGNLPLLDRN